jgi:aryl-alcohol dehydrogenase-like predicted oxidoreductase
MIERRVLGSSGLEVSCLALGAMTFGGKMPPISNVDAASADEMVERALEAGVNFVDTADAYSGGQSEEFLAPVLARHRSDLLVASKVGMAVRGAAAPLSRANVLAGVEGSLRRLGTDHLDVLYLHRPDRSTPVEETFDALADLVSRGLVRAVGLSNFTAGETGYALGRQRALGSVEPTSVQVYWSLVGREVEHEIVPMCGRLGLGVVVWSALASGYLAGRSDGRRSAFPFPPVDEALGLRVLPELRRVASETGATPAQVALAWVLQQPAVTSVIVGASSLAQLEENLAATTLALDAAHVAALDAASALPPVYPVWWERAMGVD